MAVEYKGELPINREFLQKNKGRRIVTEVEFTVDDIILANGYEEMDQITDEKLGVALDDLYYHRAKCIRQGRVVLQVAGIAR
jgi:hypothetical protein